MTGILSPSTLNLFVAKSFVLFQRTGLDASAVHLGKLTDVEYTPKVDYAEYYDESQGISILADVTPKQVGGEGKITLNELTMYNLGLMFMGSPDYSTPTAPKLAIFGNQSPLVGAFTFVMTNGKGPRMQANITNALITPTAPFKFVSKDYGMIELAFKHLADQNSQFGNVTELPDVNTIAPTNWTPPFITGLQSSSSPAVPAGGTPAKAEVANVLTCNVGQWTTGNSGVSYTFQWKQSPSTVISGATNQTYSPVVGDETFALICAVTATNSIGATTVASGVTQVVIA